MTLNETSTYFSKSYFKCGGVPKQFLAHYIFIALSWLSICSLIYYFDVSIEQTSEGGARGFFLALGLLILLVLISVRIFFIEKIYLKRSILFLFLFYSYFIFRGAIDCDNLQTIYLGTLSTGNGSLLYYIAGLWLFLVMSKNLSDVMKHPQLMPFQNLCMFGFILFSVISRIIVLSTLFKSLAPNVFIISKLDSEYQRSGSFLVIQSLIFSISYIHMTLLNQKKKTSTYRILAPLNLVLYFLFFTLTIITSQIIGSNNAFVSSFGIFFVTSSVLVYLFLISDRWNSYRVRKKLYFFLLGKSMRRILRSLALTALIIAVFVTVIFIFYSSVMLQTRIMGYGKLGVPTSITGRIDIIKNYFLVHFSHSPFMGNMNVEVETTGRGTYMHSFVLSIFTHTGILGACLFSTYFALALKEFWDETHVFFTAENDYSFHNVFKLFGILVMFFLMLVAIIGLFFTWIPIWFAFGYFFRPIVIGSYIQGHYAIKGDNRNEFHEKFSRKELSTTLGTF